MTSQPPLTGLQFLQKSAAQQCAAVIVPDIIEVLHGAHVLNLPPVRIDASKSVKQKN